MGADWPGLTLVDMGRAKVEDLPKGNAVALQIEIDQGALAHDPEGVLGRLSNCLGGLAHREVRVAFVDWIRESLGPELLKVPNLKDRLTEIVDLGEFQDMKSLMLKSMQDYWQEQGFERSMAQAAKWRIELAQADERALLVPDGAPEVRQAGGGAACRADPRGDRPGALGGGRRLDHRLRLRGGVLGPRRTRREPLAGLRKTHRERQPTPSRKVETPMLKLRTKTIAALRLTANTCRKSYKWVSDKS